MHIHRLLGIFSLDCCSPVVGVQYRHGVASWLHQVCTELNLSASDALNLALDRTSWQAVAMASRLSPS